jgi:hypothetical protein
MWFGRVEQGAVQGWQEQAGTMNRHHEQGTSSNGTRYVIRVHIRTYCVSRHAQPGHRSGLNVTTK